MGNQDIRNTTGYKNMRRTLKEHPGYLKCVLCLAPADDLHHELSVAGWQQMATYPGNIAPLCKECHKKVRRHQSKKHILRILE